MSSESESSNSDDVQLSKYQKICEQERKSLKRRREFAKNKWQEVESALPKLKLVKSERYLRTSEGRYETIPGVIHVTNYYSHASRKYHVQFKIKEDKKDNNGYYTFNFTDGYRWHDGYKETSGQTCTVHIERIKVYNRKARNTKTKEKTFDSWNGVQSYIRSKVPKEAREEVEPFLKHIWDNNVFFK